ncbi:MAG TPA: hypothetical protein VMB03_01850 [Bryobacteraceae bacterium]|nr:hypothetical protein [Bryobacteraceae bacterium]
MALATDSADTFSRYGMRLEVFSDYLRSLPDDLLESVAEDYVWLAGLDLESEGHPTDFVERREACRAECARRGTPQLYEIAEDTVSPFAA